MTYWLAFMIGCGVGIFAAIVAIELGQAKGRREAERRIRSMSGISSTRNNNGRS